MLGLCELSGLQVGVVAWFCRISSVFWAGKLCCVYVMASLEDFLRAPSEELLERCSREQLLKIAKHFKLEVRDKRLKENIKAFVKS